MPAPAIMNGRTVLITGGTGGIGLSVARDLAARGARVVVTGRDQSRGAAAAAAIRAAGGHGDAEYLVADHSTVGGNRDLAQRLRGSVSRLDVLVNNVGRVFPARAETADGYEATLALCFAGPIALTGELRPLIRAAGPARIVNLSSSAYRMYRGDPFADLQSSQRYVGIQAHARAKLLNLIWTFALAEQLKPDGIAVNAVNPGAAWTAGTAQLTPEAVPAWKYVWPLVRFFQRRAPADKAARGPAWLASAPEAAGLTGSYVEGRKHSRPRVAADPARQQRVVQLAASLISAAPTVSGG
ncbi:MAG: SDR family NAD(P)-dependent oxidoreductase [Streptosporangiaceae bacterium]